MPRFYVIVKEKVVQESVMCVDAETAEEAENKAVDYARAYPVSQMPVEELCEIDTCLTSEQVFKDHADQCVARDEERHRWRKDK